MSKSKESSAQAHQARVDRAMEAVLAFPNFMAWMAFNPSGMAAKGLDATAKRAKYEDEFACLMQRAVDAAADQEVAPWAG